MIRRIFSYFEGCAKIFVPAQFKEKFITFLLQRNLKARIKICDENDGIFAEISLENLKNIAFALDKSGIIVYIINIYSFEKFVFPDKNKIGIFSGTIFFLFFLAFSTFFVWKINFVGTDLYTDDFLRSEFAEIGVSEGVPISKINRERVKNEFLSEHPEFSHISLNISGTSVLIDLTEKVSASPNGNENYSALVAMCDGTVKEILVYSGKSAVKIGSVVKKGDVLINGFISGQGLQSSDNPPLKFEYAKGSVKAEIQGKIQKKITYENVVEEKTFGKITGFEISLFGKHLKFGKTCDTQGQFKNISIMGYIELPVSVKVTRKENLNRNTFKYSESQIKTLLNDEIYREISEFSDVKSVETIFTTENDGVSVVCEFTYIGEIAKGIIFEK